MQWKHFVAFAACLSWKSLQYFLHNFNEVKNIIIVFGKIRPETSLY